MKTLFTLVSLFIFSTPVYSGITTNYPEVNDVIHELGIELSDFSTLWPYYCNPEWTKTVTEEQAKSIKFIKNNIGNNFFSAHKNGQEITLSQGNTCKALFEYYFNEIDSDSISSFIIKDKVLINKYGYSAIDLFQFPENFQGNYISTNPTPGHSKLTLKLIKHFKSKNIFVVIDKPNGIFYVKPSNKFIQSHKKLKSESSE